jgi:hypothetical protein
MHAIVFRITINDQKEADRLLHEEFVPFMSQSSGFVAAYWVATGESQGTSVIVFESEEAARRVADQSGPPDTEAFNVETFEIGEVVAHA